MERHALFPYWELIGADLNANILGFAVSAKLFDAVEAGHTDSCSIARNIGVSENGLVHVLNILWSMGLLEKPEPTESAETKNCFSFRLTEVARRYFVSSSQEYAGDLWRFRFARMQMAASGLVDQIKTGDASMKMPSKEHFEKQWSAAAKKQLAQEQLSCTRHAATEILRTLPKVGSFELFLDLGGGPAWVAIEIARLNPQARGRIIDLPEVALSATENIAGAGLSDRLEAIGGDIDTIDFGSGFDLAWCSSVLHFVRSPAATLRRIFAALRPGGTLVCAHAELDPTPPMARQVLPYYLPLMMTGKYVGASGDMAGLMREAGFVDVQETISWQFPVAPLAVVSGRKPDEI